MNCEICGKELESENIKVLGENIKRYKVCECQINKIEQENKKIREFGEPKVIDFFKDLSGLQKIQKSQTLKIFNPKSKQLEAYDYALAYVKEKKYLNGEGILFVGDYGCGKTHLSAAIINYLIENQEYSLKDCECALKGDLSFTYQNSRYLFAKSVELLETIRASYNSGNNAQMIVNKYCKAKLVVLDDIGAEKPTEWVIERLYHIIDYRYSQGLPLVLTSNFTPKELKERLGGRIADRIRTMCKVLTITEESQRETAK